MNWARDFYSTRSEWFGPTGVFPEHRSRASDLVRLCGIGPKRILELGAGAGGTAAAIADLGYHVVAVELSPVRAAFARALAADGRPNLTVLEADFYTVHLEGVFDVVCYWDGFGVGSDADQRSLLRRVRKEWLDSRGSVLDVFSPAFWTTRAGKKERIDTVLRLVNGEVRTVRLDVPVMARYDFDPVASRFLSEWWPRGRKREMITENIRCYSPPDFEELLEGTGLTADRFEVDGQRFDPGEGARAAPEALSKSRSYLVRLISEPGR